jgi:phage antirepressor YoqD-like protein
MTTTEKKKGKSGGGKPGITEAAKELGVTESTARALLRKHKVPRKEKAYSWENRAAMNAALKKVKQAAA